MILPSLDDIPYSEENADKNINGNSEGRRTSSEYVIPERTPLAASDGIYSAPKHAKKNSSITAKNVNISLFLDE